MLAEKLDLTYIKDMTWHINILTLFPSMFPGFLGESLAGKALDRGDWSFNTINIRNFGEGVHNAVDDTPYGGGAGMVLRADILDQAFKTISNPGRKIYLSPRGRVLKQDLVQELCEEASITLLCGRYEGVDQRFLDHHAFEEISVGDYVLSGGEPAALTLMDACIRLLPGVMGNHETVSEESFSDGAQGLLEYPHYTRPAHWEGLDVPEVLTSGDHQKIKDWRLKESYSLTARRRPDLLG